jgi:hypothetical protein
VRCSRVRGRTARAGGLRPGAQVSLLVNGIKGWSNLGWRVSLTAPAATFGNETVTATANADVGPTPYYIEIFDEDTGTLIQSCASGSSCSATFTPSYAGSALVAYVSLYSTSYPPGTIVASSNEVTSYLRIIP